MPGTTASCPAARGPVEPAKPEPEAPKAPAKGHKKGRWQVSEAPSQRTVALAGFVGILGALLGGLGECALHYSARGYTNAETYRFFIEVAPWRLSTGHFLSIFAVPLYFIGYWHLYERLKPAPQWARLTILLLGLYAFTLGDAWLGSRVYLAQLAQARAVAESAGDAATAKLMSALLGQPASTTRTSCSACAWACS